MTLGLSRPRNYGREVQQSRLAIAMARGKVAYQVRSRRRVKTLHLAGTDGQHTLPFESIAVLTNTRRGHWEARHIFDDRLLATGISEIGVVAKTIESVWK